MYMNPIDANIVELYLNGIGTVEIANLYKMNRMKIQRILIRNKIKLRKGSPRHKYNINFFKEYNEKSCYWAGFILADGHIRYNRATLSIKLAKCDKNHLQKFLNDIESNYEIKEHKNYYYININGDWFIKDLYENFSITPRKTFKTFISKKIPENLLNHFIRGIFDGDGSVSLNAGINCGQINIIGTIELMQDINLILRNNNLIQLKSGNLVSPIQIQTKGKNIGSIHYSGKNANRILSWFYDDANILLERKYQKYKEIFKNINLNFIDYTSKYKYIYFSRNRWRIRKSGKSYCSFSTEIEAINFIENNGKHFGLESIICK